MDRILIILKIKKKMAQLRASSVPTLGLNTIIFKHVYWYMQQISGERLQDHWSSCNTKSGTTQLIALLFLHMYAKKAGFIMPQISY